VKGKFQHRKEAVALRREAAALRAEAAAMLQALSAQSKVMVERGGTAIAQMEHCVIEATAMRRLLRRDSAATAARGSSAMAALGSMTPLGSVASAPCTPESQRGDGLGRPATGRGTPSFGSNSEPGGEGEEAPLLTTPPWVSAVNSDGEKEQQHRDEADQEQGEQHEEQADEEEEEEGEEEEAEEDEEEEAEEDDDEEVDDEPEAVEGRAADAAARPADDAMETT